MDPTAEADARLFEQAGLRGRLVAELAGKQLCRLAVRRGISPMPKGSIRPKGREALRAAHPAQPRT